MILKNVAPSKGSSITLLGTAQPLKWEIENGASPSRCRSSRLTNFPANPPTCLS